MAQQVSLLANNLLLWLSRGHLGRFDGGHHALQAALLQGPPENVDELHLDRLGPAVADPLPLDVAVHVGLSVHLDLEEGSCAAALQLLHEAGQVQLGVRALGGELPGTPEGRDV